MAEKAQIILDVVYGDSLKTLKDQLKLANEELSKAKINTNEFAKASEKVNGLTNSIKQVTEQSKQYGNEVKKDAELQRALDIALGDTVASLGEMQKALKVIKNESFAGKSKEEIAKLNGALGTLKNNIQDSVALNKALDKGEYFNNLRSGLQGAVAAAQLLTAGLSLMGVESEEVKKLERATIQLISATQALQVIRDLKDKGTIKALFLQTKEMIQNGIQTVQTWAQTTATNAAAAAEANKNVIMGKGSIVTKAVAAAQWLWNAAMSANPIGLIIAGVAALVGGIILLTKALNTSTEESRRAALANKTLNETLLDGRKSVEESIVRIDALTSVVNDTTKSTKERTLALNELNGIMGTNLTLTDNVTEATKKYVQQLILASQVDAAIKKIAELNTTLLDTSKLYKDSAPDAISFLASGLNVAKGMQDQLENYKSNIKDTKEQINVLTNFVEKNIGTQLKNEKEKNDEIKKNEKITKDIVTEAYDWKKKISDQSRVEIIENEKNTVLGLIDTQKFYTDAYLAEIEARLFIESEAQTRRLDLLKKEKEDEFNIMTNYSERRKQSDQIESDRFKQMQSDNLAATQGALGGAMEALKLYSELSGANAKKQKSISIAMATITAIQGAINAFTSAASVPVIGSILAPIMAAIALAAGMLNVAKIKSTPIGGAAGGGADFITTKPTLLMVGDNPGGRERVSVTPLSGTGQTSVAAGGGLIRMAGGGTVSDGGFGARFSASNSTNDLKKAVIQGMQEAQPPVVSWKQYSEFSDKQTRINQRGKI